MKASARSLAGILALAAALTAAHGPDAAARELFRRGDFAVELSGSLREFVNVGQQTDADDFGDAFLADQSCLFAATFSECSAFDEVNERDAWQSLTRLRTRLDVAITPALSAVVVYDHELRTGVLDTLGAQLAGDFQRDDLFDLNSEITSSNHAAWRHLLYRGYVRLETERVDVVVGRQRIAWGVGRLWNPIDRFNAIPPLAVQADQSQGIDSIDARYAFDGFNFLEAVYAPGSSRDRARYALRLHGVVLDSDVSIVGGRFEKALTVGFDFARNIADAAVRVEAVWTDPHEKVWKVRGEKPRDVDDFFQVVVSLDYNFALGTGLYALVEHLYNGNALGFGQGKPGTLEPFFQTDGTFVTTGSEAVFGTSRVVTNAKHQTGASGGYDVTPELRFELLGIYDWNGESAAFVPSARYSPTGSLEVSLGVQAFVGPRRSQYGNASTLVYLLADFYF